MKKIYMKTQVIFIIFVSIYLGSQSQALKPASWSFKVEKGEMSPNNEVILQFIVQLDDTWQLYSTNQDPEVGPLPTEIDFEPHQSYELVGEVIELGVQEKFDSVWLGNVRYLEGKGAFLQKIRILSQAPEIKGTIKYQLCTTVDGLCIYPQKDFSFTKIMIKPKDGIQH